MPGRSGRGHADLGVVKGFSLRARRYGHQGAAPRLHSLLPALPPQIGHTARDPGAAIGTQRHAMTGSDSNRRDDEHEVIPIFPMRSTVARSLIALSLFLTLVACSAGDSPAEPTGEPAGDTVAQCNYLPIADMELLLGFSLNMTSPGFSADGTTCFWFLNTPGNPGVELGLSPDAKIEVVVGGGGSDDSHADPECPEVPPLLPQDVTACWDGGSLVASRGERQVSVRVVGLPESIAMPLARQVMLAALTRA